MAASTIDDQYVHLFDLVPGPVRHGWLPPADSNGNTFTNSSHHNVATAEYDVGFKVGVYDRTNKGHAVFAYLQMGTASGVAVAAKAIMAPGNVTTAGSNAKHWSIVTNDPDQFVEDSFACVALSAMTEDYYGWFWCGGVCPVGWVSALDGNYKTANGREVVEGGMACVDHSTNDELAFGNAYGATGATSGNATLSKVIGWSMNAQA
tara:strand:- start:7076 stop:7693 length:618 start_codon:yes stop_codon:yes gene_type:complete